MIIDLIATVYLQSNHKLSAWRFWVMREKIDRERSSISKVDIDRNNQNMITIVSIRPNIADGFLSR
jgi:hypothetical protein